MIELTPISNQVAVLFALDVMNTACMAAYVYEALVVHFGEYKSHRLNLQDVGELTTEV